MDETTVLSRANDIYIPRLFLINRHCEIQEYVLNSNMRIGRYGTQEYVDIAIPSEIVSKVHGEFFHTEYGVCYRDLNSSNGTYINDYYYGVRSSMSEKLLQDGDVLKIDGNPEYGSHPDAIILIYRNTLKESPVWQWLPFDNTDMQIDIGRNNNGYTSGVTLQDERISHNHASFFYAQYGWAVSDNQSTNGVLLNNMQIQSAIYLKELDCVQIIDNMFVYLNSGLLYSMSQIPKPEYSQTADMRNQQYYGNSDMEYVSHTPIDNSLSINIVKRTVRHGFKKLTLLKDIQLTVQPGEMVLILGGSGAGKTTFMNAVMGYEKATGYIKHGAVDIYSQYNKMKYNIGFVPQDVLLRENDTVYETLYNAAEMKMPRKTSAWEKKQRVMEVLDMVNLTHVAGSLVRSVSGGEKKRVSAGVELVADPGLFFLDEPDSGLDAQSALELMDNLRTIADAGKIVMIISHSPDRAAHLFNKVIVLAKSTEDNSGHLAFYGTVPEAKEFFDTNSLEGVVSRINGKNGMGEYYIQKWNQQKGM